MKKISLFLISGSITVGLLVCSHFIQSSIKEVDVLQINLEDAEEAIVCPGKVEYGDLSCVYHNSSAIIKNINVKPGDKVSKGDKLVSVNNLVCSQQDSSSTPQREKNSHPIPSSVTPEMAEIYKDILRDNSSSPSISVNSGAVAENKVSNITASKSGIVVSVNTKPGEVIEPSTPIISIADENSMQIRMPVNESRISDIKEGQIARITGNGFKGDECIGKIKSISSEAKQILSPSGNETVVDVLLSLEQKTQRVKPGFTAKCKIITEYQDNILIIPHECVVTDKNGKQFVYVYNHGIASKRYIETRRDTQKGITLTSGVEPLEYIVNNPETLSGDNVRVKAEFSERV